MLQNEHFFSDRGRVAEVGVRSQTSDGQSGSGAGFVPSSYVVLCQYHITSISIPINSYTTEATQSLQFKASLKTL